MSTTLGSFTQLAAIGSINSVFNINHTMNRPIDHVSQNTIKINLNQIISLSEEYIDLVENIFLLFPEKYNEFCFHSDYPLNCIKSVTVEIISKTSQPLKIIYYSPLKCLPLNETYNTLEYVTIDDDYSVFIPKSFKYDKDERIFAGSFFQKQRIIICPLRFKPKDYDIDIKVSIQRCEETLFSINIDEGKSYINNNIKNLVNLYLSNPIHLKPIPITYIGSSFFNVNTVIPDHVLKNESLDNVSLEFIQEERKLWSDYNHFQITERKHLNNFKYTFDQDIDDQLCSYLFFVREADLYNIEEINFIIGSENHGFFPGIWLQTRYEEYKLNMDKEKKDLLDGFILLPIPPIYSKNIIRSKLSFWVELKNHLIGDLPNIFFKSKKDNQFVPEDISTSAILQLNNKYHVPYFPQCTEIDVKCKVLLCQFWGMVTYKDNICLASSPHPFLKLQFILNNGYLFSEESADYYHKVVPVFFEQPIAQKYLIYRMVFHNTPISFSYPVTKNPYEPAQYIANQSHHSTLNASRIDNIHIKVFWDEEVIKQHYPETDQLKLYFFSESLNLLGSSMGHSRLRFCF